MTITLDYRNPTPTHCDVAVFVNGALAGTLTLRQCEVGSFQMVLQAGCAIWTGDHFRATGDPGEWLGDKGQDRIGHDTEGQGPESPKNEEGRNT